MKTIHTYIHFTLGCTEHNIGNWQAFTPSEGAVAAAFSCSDNATSLPEGSNSKKTPLIDFPFLCLFLTKAAF